MKTQQMMNRRHACQRRMRQQQASKMHAHQNQQGRGVRWLKRLGTRPFGKRPFAKYVGTRLNVSTLVMASVLIGCVLISPAFGVAVEDLKAPIKDLKETIFGGWMWVPKIGAAVGGCLLAVYNQSIMPLATGAGVGLGIHFYDLYIKADGALI